MPRTGASQAHGELAIGTFDLALVALGLARFAGEIFTACRAQTGDEIVVRTKEMSSKSFVPTKNVSMPSNDTSRPTLTAQTLALARRSSTTRSPVRSRNWGRDMLVSPR